jgi:hypothetical protein
MLSDSVTKFFNVVVINVLVFFVLVVVLLSGFEMYYRYNEYPEYKSLNNFKAPTKGYFNASYPNISNSIYNLIPGEYSRTKAEFTESFTVNEHGYRDVNFNQDEKIDVVIYGDSFTFGHGMSRGERFSDLLAGKKPNLNIANFAYNAGFTSPHYLLHFNLNEDLDPDKIFVFTYLGNDCHSDIDESKIISYEDGGYPLRIVHDGNIYGDREQYPYVVKFLIKQSVFLYHVFKDIYNSEYASLVFDKKSLPNQYNPVDFDMGEQLDSCSENLRYIKSLVRQCKLRHEACEFHNFLIPQGFLVYDDEHTYHSQLNSQQRVEAFNNKMLIARVMGNCAKQGVSCIDLTKEFLGGSERYYLKVDGHWNKKGHLKVSQLLQRYVD